MPGPWERYQTQPSGPWERFQQRPSPMPAPNLNDPKLSQSLIYSRMFNQSPGTAYQFHDELEDQLKQMGVESGPSIAQDIKVGAQNSIFGLRIRHKLPDTLQNADMLDNFVSGLSTMVSDLPFYLAGGFLGGLAGSEVPVVGNAAGAAMGSFAVPAAIRKSLVLGIKKGQVQSFGDIVDRLGDVALAGVEGAATGAAFHVAGLATLPVAPFTQPMVGMAMRRLQQVAAMTILPDLFEGRIPTAQDFAMNAALFTAMHYSAKALGMAPITAQKVHAKMMEAYEQTGHHPADIAAEALKTAKSGESDPIDRLNEIIREAQAGAEKQAEAKGAEPEKPVTTEPPPPGLRPAIRVGEDVTAAGEGERHTDIEGIEKAEEGGQAERGFVDSKGQFYNREEAKSWVRQNEPEVATAWEQTTGDPNAEFHSQDYNDARMMSTGIKNSAVDAQREQMGLPPIEGPMRSLDPDNWEVAKEDVDSGRLDPLKIAEAINKNPRGLSPEETNALNYYRARLSNDHKTAMDAIERARADGDTKTEQRGREQLRDVEDRINTVDEATKRAGTEWGLTGLMRQRMVAQDYSLDRLIQRARIASPSGEVSDAIRERLETLSRQLEDANKKIEDLQGRQSQRDAQETVDRIKRETARTKRKGERAQVRVELKVDFDNLTKKLDKILVGRMSANPFFDPEVLGILGDMARNRIESGITRIEDIVDDIHGALTNLGHDVTKRDLRDAISGYGKTIEMSKDEIDVALREARRQGKLISALEDAESKRLPLRSGLQRDKASDRVRELQQQVKQAMREAGIDVRKSQTPERQWKTALEAVKTRLRNQITDINRQLQTGQKTPPREGIVYDEEANALREHRDQLRDTLREMTGDTRNRKMTDEQKIKMATAATEKLIGEYERRIAENDLTPAQRRAGAPETPQLRSLRERLDALRETYRQMKEAGKPKKTPEQAALDRYKKHVQKRIEDMQGRLKSGDFTKEPQKRTVLDPEAMDLKAKAEKLRRQMDDEIAKQERDNWTPTEKALHFFSKWRRFTVLTSPHTFGKLTMAAMYRMGVTPVEELIGGVLSKIPGVSAIAERAPTEGHFSPSAEVKAFSQAFQKATLDDVWSMLKTGETSLDLLFGSHSGRSPREALDFMGNLHGALKVLPKRAEFFRRLEIGTQWALDHGLDIYDPKVQSALTAQAYEQANRAIFMNKNVVTSAYNMMLTYMHNQGAGGKAVEAGMRFFLPIVKVPTNFAAEIAAYSPGGFAWQTLQLFRVLLDQDRLGKSAMDNLSMHDMDNIMRGLKKGSAGLALFSIGFALRGTITGYYNPSQKRMAGEPGMGSVTIGGVTIPKFLLESPALETLQLGATVGNVWDHYNQKGQSGGFVAGALYGAKGVAETVPFFEQPARIMQQTRTPEQTGVWAGELAASLLVPLGGQQVAEWTDPAGRDRKATTPWEAIQLAIPGLRENVPLRSKKRFSIRDLE